MGRNIARSRRPQQAYLIVAALLVAAILAACATPEPPPKRTTVQEINARAAAAGVFADLGDGRNCIYPEWLNKSRDTGLPVDAGEGYTLKITNTCRNHGITVFWCVGDECGRGGGLDYHSRVMNISPNTHRRLFVPSPDLGDIDFRACRGYIDVWKWEEDGQVLIDNDTGAITCRIRDREAWDRSKSNSIGSNWVPSVFRIPYWYGRPDLGTD